MTDDRRRTARCWKCDRLLIPTANNKLPKHGPRERPCGGSGGYPKQVAVNHRGRRSAATVDDEVSIDELQEAVEHLHGVPATFVESVDVDERFNGAVVWQGTVNVFALAGHPSGATRAYAWSHRTEGTRRKFKAVLGVPPVDSAVMAVRASIVAAERKREN